MRDGEPVYLAAEQAIKTLFVSGRYYVEQFLVLSQVYSIGQATGCGGDFSRHWAAKAASTVTSTRHF
jgi:hypothetical protein